MRFRLEIVNIDILQHVLVVKYFGCNWCGIRIILNTDYPPNERYGHVYENPHSIHNEHLKWIFLHVAISTATFCFRSEYERSDLCTCYGKQEDLITDIFLFLARGNNLLSIISRVPYTVLFQTQHFYLFSSFVQLLLGILTKRQNSSFINRLHLANRHPRPAVQQEYWR